MKHSVFHYFFNIVIGFFEGIIVSVAWIAIFSVGYILFSSRFSPFDLIFGLPLILIGGGMALSKIWETVATLISVEFNKRHCRICNYKL